MKHDATALRAYAFALRSILGSLEKTIHQHAPNARREDALLVDEVRSETEAMMARLAIHADQLEHAAHRATQLRMQARARDLLLLYEVGALSEETALELTRHTERETQTQYDYPPDLQEKLREGDLIQAMLPLVKPYNMCINGTWVIW